MTRTVRGAAALLLACALVAGACSDGDGDGGDDSAAGAGDGAVTTTGGAGTATTEPDGGTDDGGPTEVVIPEALLAAPPDCVVNPFCAPGLRERYGLDVRAALVPVEAGEAAAAVLAGEVMAGVVFTADPVLALDEDPDLLVLEDDLGMTGAENVVPFAPLERAVALGAAFVETVNAVSADLTTEDLALLVAAATERSAADAIAAWVDEHGPFGRVSASGRGEVPIGAQAFLENRVLAELYAAALADAGYTTRVVDVQGFRPYLVDAVVFGDVALGIDYAASAVEFLSGFQGVATDDIATTVETLREYAGTRDVLVFEPAPAESANAFVMRADVAEELGIRTIGDLAAVFPSVVAAAEDERPPNLGVGSAPDDPGVGATGERVTRLELRLIALGYNPGPADGVFDQLTREAVVAFQACQGLAPDGVVGPMTQAALDAPRPCVGTGGGATTTTAPGTTATTSPGGPSPVGAGRVVYFTFDDGPHPTYTPQVLDVLDRYGARATFFDVGQQVAAQPTLVQRMLREGHTVQNHTWSHPDLSKVGRDQFFSEINATNDAIVGAGGPRPGCLRPPYGARTATTDAWAAEAGLRVVLWQIDPQDWRRPGVGVIVDNIVRFVRDGSIVLLHDGGGNREQTVAALDQALSQLSAAGYRFEALAC